MLFSLTNFSTGFAVGYGFGFFTREIVRSGQNVIRPMARNTIRTTISAFEKGKESVAHFGESLEDLIAEARAKDSQTTARSSSSPSSKSSSTAKKRSTRKKASGTRKKKAS